MLNGYRASFGGDDNILESGSSNGCTHCDCTKCYFKMVNFMNYTSIKNANKGEGHEV